MENFAVFCKTLEASVPNRAGEFRQAAAAWEQGQGKRAAEDAVAALRKELERVRRYEETGGLSADLTLAEQVKQARDKMSAAGRAAREFAASVAKPFLSVKMPAFLAKAAMWIRPVGDFVERVVDSAAEAFGFVPGAGKIVRKFPHVIVHAVGGVRGVIRDRKEIAAKAKAFGKKAREAAKAVAPVVAEGFRKTAERVRAGTARVAGGLRRGAQWARAAAGHAGAALKKGVGAVVGGMKRIASFLGF